MKQAFKELKGEIVILALLYISISVIFKLIYFREGLITTVRTTLAIFWLFAIPGYALTLNWKKHLGLAERLVVGSALAAGLTGIASYYAGLIGINMGIHWLLAPLFLIALGLGLYLAGLREKNEKAD